MSESNTPDESRQLWLSSSPIECDFNTIWDEVKQFVYDNVDLPEPEQYDVLTSWILCTYAVSKFPVTPYVKFIAPVASGKTRGLDVLYYLSHQSMKTSTISTSAIYRILDKWDATLVLDETERYMKDVEIHGILNAGYKRGDVAIRVTNSKDNELGFYKTLGFKALAGTEQLKNTLESRCIVINMQKAIRRVNFMIDEDKATELRGKLSWVAMNNLNNMNELKTLPEELMYSNGRFAELYAPLVYMAKFFNREENIVKYARDVWDDYQNAEDTSVEAQVLLAVLDCERNGFLTGQPARFSTTDVARYFNVDRDTREQWKPANVGRILVRMGFKSSRLSNGRKGYSYDEKRINRLKERYNVE